MLTHKAEEGIAAIAAAKFIVTGHGHVYYAAIPSVVYTHPEVAWVGETEQDLKAKGVKYNFGKFGLRLIQQPRQIFGCGQRGQMEFWVFILLAS